MRLNLNRLFRRPLPFVVIVSGLPRSGTSMMMRMLEAGGLPLLTDRLRPPDQDNPNGYFELESVKKLQEEGAHWLKDHRGKGVKIVSPLLKSIPRGLQARILFMRRDMEEILRSQQNMLQTRRVEAPQTDDAILASSFARHLRDMESWLRQQPQLQTLYVHYGQVIENPREQSEKICRFLGGWLSPKKMAAVVDVDLYRQRLHRA